MAHVSHRLKSALEGALAGGGDPATSPLYVFGPFLRLIVVAGVANVTFGASLWLVVLTVVCVSAMYRLVMGWVTDGSGGSGLCEEEFGPWAVKVNASITFIEYTLTFLVSIAALVTFIADRVPQLAGSVALVPYRTVLAIGFTLITAALVNRGPRVAARAFGPATLAVLVLLWVMIGATIFRFGLVLPRFDLRALSPQYLPFTLGGYARILALMTGVEVFANLVSAYDGSARRRSVLAFRSLLIIMGTTSVTMLVVGPAMFAISDPRNQHLSVFTQTMDQLLPRPLPLVGTMIGVAVLLSAAAASAQGLQNLALGLRYRHYVPSRLGQRNAADVADRPVWIQAAIVCVCFAAFGTHEETYLALYAAGVFVLLSLTGWAAIKRLVRELRRESSAARALMLVGTVLAALLTSVATVIIFRERFREGAWIYLALVPILYLGLTYFRARLGAPSMIEDRIGRLLSDAKLTTANDEALTVSPPRRVLVHLDGSVDAEQALPTALELARASGASVEMLGVAPDAGSRARLTPYLRSLAATHGSDEISMVEHVAEDDSPITAIAHFARELSVDLVVLARGGTLSENVVRSVVEASSVPVLIVKPSDAWHSRRGAMRRILIAVDGSQAAERTLPSALSVAHGGECEVILQSVPEGSESEDYPAMMERYLARLSSSVARHGVASRVIAAGSGPARSIISTAESEDVALIVLGARGRGGDEGARRLRLGSVAQRVLSDSSRRTLIVP